MKPFDSTSNVSRYSRRISGAQTVVAQRPPACSHAGTCGKCGLESQTYPPDELGQEMSEYARVWRIYIDEATKADTILVDGCNRSIDVLLVFTGLFSAVLTTFVVQSYQFMVPSSVDETNALLAQLIALQTNENASSALSLKFLPSSSSSTQIRWVNGLWFAALTCSLSSALVSMLAKQWLQIHSPHTSGSHLLRARQRQIRHTQLQSWHVLALINALPLFLHAALLLFFAGLILLLWAGDPAITISTFIIVGLVYIFYFGSMWLSMINPDCPYQHPISSQLRTIFLPEEGIAISAARKDLEAGSQEGVNLIGVETRPLQIIPEDSLDTAMLIWMIRRCTDAHVAVAALQSIAALPRDFTATHVLRDAGAIPLVLREFQICFQKDSTLDVQWHVINPDAAEKYCRAWMNLTRGTGETWPSEFMEPLQKLVLMKSHADLNAIATCLQAVISLSSHPAQTALVHHLECFANGELQLTQATECWLIDLLSECSFNWELSTAQIDDIKRSAVPVLLRLLFLNKVTLASNVRSTIGLALSALTGGIEGLTLFESEEVRRESYFELIIPALSVIVHHPSRYGVEDELLDMTARELSRLASPVFCQTQRFKPTLKEIARHSLSKMYMDGRIRVKLVSDDVLADVLQMLFPPTNVAVSQHPLFVTTLLDTLRISTHPAVISWSVRLLEPLLLDCRLSVIETFIDGNGINALLRIANTGETDSRRLQVDCLRTLCTFIKSSTTLYAEQRALHHFPSEAPIDQIFQSDFFKTICVVVSSQRWWLPEVADSWLPSLLNLCQIRPQDPVWVTVVVAFQKFADNSEGEDHCLRLISDLDVIRGLYQARALPT